MIFRHRMLAVASALVGTLAAVSCGKIRPKPIEAPLTIAAGPGAAVKAPMTIAASADTNPDATGRPSPVVVRIYQLKTDKRVLGPELISRDEFVLAPAEQRTIDVSVAGETRFVGAIAAFRDIRNAQWRVLVPASRKGLSVAVERARVVLSVVAN
jgi:type VI secretion system VasD/TssJ family lipoprotein